MTAHAGIKEGDKASAKMWGRARGGKRWERPLGLDERTVVDVGDALLS